MAFPQYGRGALPTNGFLQSAHWSIADTGVSDPAFATDPAPSVALFTESDPSTLAIWPHKFEAMYTVRLPTPSLYPIYSYTRVCVPVWQSSAESGLSSSCKAARVAACKV